MYSHTLTLSIFIYTCTKTYATKFSHAYIEMYAPWVCLTRVIYTGSIFPGWKLMTRTIKSQCIATVKCTHRFHG